MLTPCFSVPSSDCEEFENNSEKNRKAVGSTVTKGRKRLRAKTVTIDRREESEQSEHAEERQSDALRRSEEGRNDTLSSLHTRLLSFSAVLSTVREQVDNVKVRVGVLEAFAAARGVLDGTSTGAS